jgi:hypothetical protein
MDLKTLVTFLLSVIVGTQANLFNGFCVQRFNQVYCNGKGTAYPDKDINGYIDDNKALIRRMYGTLIQQEEPQPLPLTPASTIPFIRRTVRTLPRFRRQTAPTAEATGISFEDLSEPEGPSEEFLNDAVDETYGDLFKSFNVTLEDREVLKSLVLSSWGAAQQRSKRQAGFPGSQEKDSNKVDVCDSFTEVTTPYWATNSKGKVRAIVNNKQFEQAVHQEICGKSVTPRCSRDCRCEQKFKWHRLLAYDPNNPDCGGIFMDWFLFPSCCACRCQRNPLLDGIASN